MPFFSDTTANLLQHIALPMEAIAFATTFIEVMYPGKADKIEMTIDQFARLRYQDFYKTILDPEIGKTSQKNSKTGFLIYYTKILLGLSIVIGSVYASQKALGYLFLRFHSFFDSPGALGNPFVYICGLSSFWAILAIFIFLIPRVFLGSLAFLSFILTILDKWSKGSALGSFGLILAAIGLNFELYQVLTIHFG